MHSICINFQVVFIPFRNGNAVSYNGLETILQQLQKLAPELHRVS